MEIAKSFRQLAAATGYSVSNLHEKVRKGQIPQRSEDGWRVAEVLSAIRRNVDPVRRKPIPAHRSGVNGPVNGPVNAERFEGIPADPPPDPAVYRARTDLPDDFARGALYGAHAVAYQLPHTVALALNDRCAPHAEQIAAFRGEVDAAFLLVKDPMVALGIEDETADEPTALSPTAFLGFTVGGGTGR